MVDDHLDVLFYQKRSYAKHSNHLTMINQVLCSTIPKENNRSIGLLLEHLDLVVCNFRSPTVSDKKCDIDKAMANAI